MEMKLGEAACNYMQVLPDSTPGHEASTTLTALNKAVDAALGLGPNAARELRKMGQHLRTYRQSTKALIHALRNALQVLLPGYNFRSSIPDVLLRPCGSMIRYPMSDAEKEFQRVLSVGSGEGCSAPGLLSRQPATHRAPGSECG